MIENYNLANKLRRNIEKELASFEVVQWIEQPIPRFLTRSTLGVCLTLLVTLSFFSFAGFSLYEQARNAGRSLYEFPGIIGIFVFLIGTIVTLILIFLVPFSNWLEATQTVYVITNQRAFILIAGWSTTVTSFMPSELKVISRRENRDGSGDVIVYIHRSKDYDGDVHTQEIGFKQVHNSKVFENRLRQIKLS
jgi:magnesium-transporting ATPase (P-type)